METVSLHCLVSPSSFSPPFKATRSKVSSNENTSTDQVHLFLSRGNGFYSIPDHAQSMRKTAYVMDAVGAGERSYSSGGPAAHACGSSVPQGCGGSAMIGIWKLSALDFAPSSALWLPRKQKASQKTESFCTGRWTITSASCPEEFGKKIKSIATCFQKKPFRGRTSNQAQNQYSSNWVPL